MKGAIDGGIYIPHSTKRFPGHSSDGYNAEKHAARIYGQHVEEYMDKLKNEDEGKFEKQFNKWKSDMNVENIDSLADTYKKVHS